MEQARARCFIDIISLILGATRSHTRLFVVVVVVGGFFCLLSF